MGVLDCIGRTGVFSFLSPFLFGGPWRKGGEERRKEGLSCIMSLSYFLPFSFFLFDSQPVSDFSSSAFFFYMWI